MLSKQLPARATGSKSSPRASRFSRVPRVCVKAQASARQDGALAFADSIGLPTDEGLFGFKPFAELWTGRLAMMGFVTSIVEEFTTGGQGTLAQIGVMAPNLQPDPAVLVLLCLVFGGATLYATIDTVQKVVNKKLSKRDIARYKNFLGLNNEAASSKEAAAMKARGDFTSLGVDKQAIAAAKAAGTPADAFLSTNEVVEGEAAARDMKAKPSAQEVESAVQKQEDAMLLSERAELAYGQQVEMNNGRMAMLGFLAAVLVEAATGHGILGQLIMYGKWSGLLGPASGF